MESLVSEEYIVPAVSALISIISAIIALVGLFFTYRKNQFDKRLSLDKELFEAAVRKLESAFEMLTHGMGKNALVVSERLNWIMCASEIEKFKVFKSKLNPRRLLQRASYWFGVSHICVCELEKRSKMSN